jgi:hypothetical protein
MNIKPEQLNEVLYGLYESGLELNYCVLLLDLNKNYTREKAREVITSYINKFLTWNERVHPLLTMSYLHARQILDLLQQDSKGVKINIFSDGPSIF